MFQGQEEIKIYINFEKLWEEFKENTYATTTAQSDKVQTNDFGEVTKNKIGRTLTNFFGSKSISRKSGEEKVRCREFDIITLTRVVSNYFDEKETEKLKQEIQQHSTQNTSKSNANQ